MYPSGSQKELRRSDFFLFFIFCVLPCFCLVLKKIPGIFFCLLVGGKPDLGVSVVWFWFGLVGCFVFLYFLSHLLQGGTVAILPPLSTSTKDAVDESRKEMADRAVRGARLTSGQNLSTLLVPQTAAVASSVFGCVLVFFSFLSL